MIRKRLTHHIALWAYLMLCVVTAPVTGSETPSVLVKTTAVEQQQVSETLTAYGTLDPDPDQVLSLSLPHAGLINRVWVRLGQRVKSGDSLLEVITAPDARMQYLQAQSAVDYAQRELDRQQRLLGEQLATKAAVDAARKNLQDARATLEALKQRGQGLEKETLRAPMDGIVTRLDLSQGQRVQADTTAMLIAAEQRLIARLGIEPEDLARVQPGQSVIITSVFVPDISIDSRVREVHAMVDPATHLVEVLVPIPDNASRGLVLGSRVIGTLQMASSESLVVPRSAVLSDQGQTYVFTVANGKAHRVVVTAGNDAGERVAVSGDLQVGDRVVTSGNYQLVDGMAVRDTP
ncbi:efflux RND transporter periplasmic adaptor subunit [Marinobacter sp. SS8-8]|uniref:efflux RND transporter periplasmic adaptor subunit n=1 Tax=Marinobacter sp. SS8-8 TaxID=3050452 RepID=UPI0026DFF075|nr:efflux RND transporter periplasmic adaptor subunit [Marinobacter sp. SS8-8]